MALYLALLKRKSPELALIVERWEHLPGVLRTGVLAMVRASAAEG